MHKKTYLKVILILSFVLILTACDRRGEFEYVGPYPELFSVAMGSMLGVRGEDITHFTRYHLQPQLAMLDEDDYGRVLFQYTENWEPISVIIMQKFEDDYVYFYPHYNFFQDLSRSFVDPPHQENLATLKEKNNWNQPMSSVENFNRVQISRSVDRGSVPNEYLLSAYYELFTGEDLRRQESALNTMVYLRSDHYGRSIYFAEGIYDSVNQFGVLFFQPDFSFDSKEGLMLLSDRINYQTELRLFMEANGWNMPPTQ